MNKHRQKTGPSDPHAGCHNRVAWALAFGLFLLPGCRSPRASTVESQYTTVAEGPRRDTDRARQLHQKAHALIEDQKFEEAERELKAALVADVTFGPAHNNLGKVYFHQNKLYQAAWEFQYAARLMPDQVEPKNNLGLVLEAAGKLDEAVTHYQEAHDRAPDHVQVLGNLARARFKRGDRDEQTADLLRQVVLKDTREEWVAWAQQKLLVIDAAMER